MNKRSSTFTVAGVVVAVLGALMVFAYGRTVSADAKGSSGGPAFVTINEVPVGTSWEDAVGSLKKQEIPQSLRPAGAVSDPDRLKGRSAVRSISRGEVVTAAQFEGAGSTGLDIPRGHNGIAFSMPLPQGGARYVQQGSTINIYATYKGGAIGPEGTAPVTKLILSNVKVLAHQPHQQGAEQAAPGVGAEVLLTLALSPDDSEKMVYARENGTLWFGIVRPGDGPAATAGRTPKTALR